MLTATPGTTRRTDVSRQPHAHAPRRPSRADIRLSAQLASAADAAMLQERSRIARELHDSVSQTLYAITLSASRALDLLKRNEDDQTQQVISELLRLADGGQSELRAILTNLRSDLVKTGGLTGGLASLAADFRTRHGLEIRLSHMDEPDVPPATKEELVLICREALHNVVKHAHASRVDIVLQIHADELVLLITDNGRGFDQTVSRPGHFGLRSMRERAAATRGTLELVSVDGVGTQIRVGVPRSSGR